MHMMGRTHSFFCSCTCQGIRNKCTIRKQVNYCRASDLSWLRIVLSPGWYRIQPLNTSPLLSQPTLLLVCLCRTADRQNTLAFSSWLDPNGAVRDARHGGTKGRGREWDSDQWGATVLWGLTISVGSVIAQLAAAQPVIPSFILP